MVTEFKKGLNYSYQEIQSFTESQGWLRKEIHANTDTAVDVIGESFIIIKPNEDSGHVISFVLVSTTALHYFYEPIYIYLG